MTTPKKIAIAGVFTLAMVGVMFALRGSDESSAAPKGPGEKARSPVSASPAESKPKNAKTTITLIDAIAIAEKHAKGRATKAELKEKPELSFKVEVMTWDGHKSKLELSADGTVRTSQVEDRAGEKEREKGYGEKEKKGKKGGERSRD